MEGKKKKKEKKKKTLEPHTLDARRREQKRDQERIRFEVCLVRLFLLIRVSWPKRKKNKKNEIEHIENEQLFSASSGESKKLLVLCSLFCCGFHSSSLSFHDFLLFFSPCTLHAGSEKKKGKQSEKKKKRKQKRKKKINSITLFFRFFLYGWRDIIGGETHPPPQKQEQSEGILKGNSAVEKRTGSGRQVNLPP